MKAFWQSIKIKPLDLIVVICLFVASFSPLIFLSQKANASAVVQVKALGKVVKELPLDKDTTWTYDSKGEINKLEIKNKQMHVYYANCPDKLDVKQGWVSTPGKAIVCLPHALTITIVNGNGQTPVIKQDGKVVDYNG